MMETHKTHDPFSKGIWWLCYAVEGHCKPRHVCSEQLFLSSRATFLPWWESDLFKTDNAFIHRASGVTDGADGLMSNYEATAVSTAQHED